MNPGGQIYFAVYPETGEVLGCCALLAMEDGCFEVAKMAIAERTAGRELDGNCYAAQLSRPAGWGRDGFTLTPITH